MEGGASRLALLLISGCLFIQPVKSQQSRDPFTNSASIPANFRLDLETAARLRPELVAQSVAAVGRYTDGRLVFERLVKEVRASGIKPAWELRIVEDGQRNAFSSPDGTVYVENGLARLAGQSTGLWAAILSHEIAHVMRRDWARRYAYRKSLQSSGGGNIALGDPGLSFDAWQSTEKASEDMARFSRRLEEEADRDGLMLMARAGYHPDFVPALHHLLHAQGAYSPSAALYAMHPCWEERDRELQHAYEEASIEFDRRWPEWYASPGGNPPIVVFAEAALVKRTGPKDFEIRVPMRCENLAGTVEVVLRRGSERGRSSRPDRLSDQAVSNEEIRQLTGCTSPRTMITFSVTDSARRGGGAQWTDIYVVDASGAVLARADVPKLR